jgi:hypothetical protein
MRAASAVGSLAVALWTSAGNPVVTVGLVAAALAIEIGFSGFVRWAFAGPPSAIAC